MDARDLRHLVDTYLEAAGLAPCEAEPAGFLSLSLTQDQKLGVQWLADDELLLFANPGCVHGRIRAAAEMREQDPDADPDDDEDVAGNELVRLDSDEHGSWSLHISDVTALVTLCLHADPGQLPGPAALAAAIDRFRERFEMWSEVLNLDSATGPAVSYAPSGAQSAPGLDAWLRP